MSYRELAVTRRQFGGINQAETIFCHTISRANEDADSFQADFTAPDVIAFAAGTPDLATFEAVIGAIQAFGRALAGTDGTHDERARLVTRDEGATVEIWFIDVPPVGDPSDPFYYTLAEVKATPGAPSGADFDAVTAKFIAYSDSVSGYA